MKRNPMLDVAKLLFILPIILIHSNQLVSHTYEYGADCIVFPSGYAAVEFFFIVSGLFMAHRAERCKGCEKVGDETLKFAKSKFSNTLPYFIVPFIIGFIFQNSVEQSSTEQMLKNLMLSVFTILEINIGGFGHSSYVGPAWYISAMIMAGLILYPLLLKHYDYYIKVLAPLMVVFLYGYIAQTVGNTSAATVWTGFAYVGMLRAIAGMALGCICYDVALKIMAVKFTAFGKTVLTLLEMICYMIPLVIMATSKISLLDFFMVLCFALAVTISFSKQSHFAAMFKREHPWIGKLSTSLYLSHMSTLYLLEYFTPNWDRWQRFTPYLLLCLIIGVANMLAAEIIKKLWEYNRRILKKCFVNGQ